jgi:hypothetical protein
MAAVFHLNLKELVMNELKQAKEAKEVELVELGEATSLTKGFQRTASDGQPAPNNKQLPL